MLLLTLVGLADSAYPVLSDFKIVQSGLKLIVTKIFQTDVVVLACLCVKMCTLQSVMFSAHVCCIRTVVPNGEWVLLMHVSGNMLTSSPLKFKHAN